MGVVGRAWQDQNGFLDEYCLDPAFPPARARADWLRFCLDERFEAGFLVTLYRRGGVRSQGNLETDVEFFPGPDNAGALLVSLQTGSLVRPGLGKMICSSPALTRTQFRQSPRSLIFVATIQG